LARLHRGCAVCWRGGSGERLSWVRLGGRAVDRARVHPGAAAVARRVTRSTLTLFSRGVLSLAFIVGYGFIVMEFLRIDREVSEPVERILIFLFGALTTSVVTIVNFWFSSSQGSADKSAHDDDRSGVR
jgi:nitrate reductase NapE component